MCRCKALPSHTSNFINIWFEEFNIYLSVKTRTNTINPTLQSTVWSLRVCVFIIVVLLSSSSSLRRRHRHRHRRCCRRRTCLHHSLSIVWARTCLSNHQCFQLIYMFTLLNMTTKQKPKHIASSEILCVWTHVRWKKNTILNTHTHIRTWTYMHKLHTNHIKLRCSVCVVVRSCGCCCCFY